MSDQWSLKAGVAVSDQWSLKAGGLLIQGLSNTGLTVLLQSTRLAGSFGPTVELPELE